MEGQWQPEMGLGPDTRDPNFARMQNVPSAHGGQPGFEYAPVTNIGGNPSHQATHMTSQSGDISIIRSPQHGSPHIPASDLPWHVAYGDSIPDPDAIEESGRTYHNYKDGVYFLPNDAAEQNRLDLQHQMWDRMLRGSLNLAPVGSPANVLDIGTGTGIWAQKFAEQHPNSNVVGTDLSVIQPVGRFPNCHFVREDAEEDEWLFSHSFDYIHLRLMVSCFKSQRAVLKKIFHHLSPGGWVEYQEGGMDIWCQDESTLGTNLHKWSFLMKAGAMALGRDLEVAQKLKTWMVETGFVDVVEKVILIPGNEFPDDLQQKEVGYWVLADLLRGVEGLSLRILQKGLGMSLEGAQTLVEQVKKDMVNLNHHYYWVFRVVYGRKPYDWELQQASIPGTIPVVYPNHSG